MEAGGMDAHLVRDLDIDSLDAIELIMDAEDMLGAQIENTEIMWVKTLRDIFEVIKYKIENDNMPYPIPEFDEEDIIFRPTTDTVDGKEVHSGNSAYKQFMAGTDEKHRMETDIDKYLEEEEEREKKLRDLLDDDDDDLSVGHNK
jgi:acyl carrier protein